MVGMTVTGCKKSALDIQASDLHSACEFVDALEALMDEMIALKGNVQTIEELSAADKEKQSALEAKIDEISDAAEEKYPKVEAQKCDNFETLGEKVKQLRGWLH